jgi:predicted anti-sigma-YlaC factor YlaD
MMDCETVQSFLDDLLDGTLGAAQAEAVSAHLYDCGDCRREYQALRATVEMVRSMKTPDAGASRLRVMNRFRAMTDAPEPAHPMRWRLVLAPTGMVSAAVLLWVLWLVPHNSDSVSRSSEVQSPVIAVTAAASHLPSQSDLDQMTSMHVLESFSIPDGERGMQRDALADATARLQAGSLAR